MTFQGLIRGIKEEKTSETIKEEIFDDFPESSKENQGGEVIGNEKKHRFR